MVMLKGGKEFICKCYLEKNIFLNKYNLHVKFRDENSFQKEYRQILRMQGCSTDQQYQTVLNEIKEEIDRRCKMHNTVADRVAHFMKAYKYLHPNIKHLDSSHFDNRFLNIIEDSKKKSLEKLFSSISNNNGSISEMEIYKFPVFTPEFCKLLMEELENFEKTPGPKSRPNTMNHFGILMEEVGLAESFIVPLVKSYLTPICAVLFPAWGGATLDSFKAFTVKYQIGSDLALSEHYDNAEVTINVSLSDGFEGGELSFGQIHGEDDRRRSSYTHEAGYGILHCGRRMHKALPITKGMRSNLIIWMRSSAIRNHLCPMCGEPPDLMEVPAAGEGFTTVDVCSCS